MSPPNTLTVPQAFALALQHHHAGRLAEAKALYREILVAEPNHTDALHHLGILAHQVGRNDVAVELIGQAIRLEPKSPGAHLNLGEAYRVMGRLDEAIACYHRALELKPDYAEAHNNLGTALAKAGRLDEALAAFRRALECKPDYPDAQNKLGIALVEQGKLDEGVATFRRAIELKPDYPETHINLGNALKIKGQRDDAVAAFRRAIQLNPNYIEAHYNLGTTLRDQGLLPEAVACYQRAVTLKSDFAAGHLSLGLLLLLLGRYEEGWREYEWRWQTPLYQHCRRNFSVPVWEGKAAEGRTIFIHTEQGYGDTLQSVRYLPLVGARSRATRVVFECQPPLVPLLQQLRSPEIEIVARGESDELLPPFDLYLPLLSLPLTLACFDPRPSDAPYLQADAKLRTQWRRRLGRSKKLRVGLAWAGNPVQEDDHRRSIPPEKLAPILGVKGVRFVSLQIEPRGPLPPTLTAAGVLDFSADIASFADSAALIAELDLIITVDTATAHLAGALGCPAWVMLSSRPYWPYGLGREDTPWYPSMRLFRQTMMGDWADVVERVAAALHERLA